MFASRCILIVGVSLVLSGLAKCESLSAKQEADIVKFISHEILIYDVHDEATLNKCLVKLTALLRPYMRYGIKTWNVPVLEPMFLKSVRILTPETQLKAHFKDVLIYGLSKFKVNYIKTYPEKYTFDFSLQFPDLKLLGYYNLDGQILIMKLKDHGPFTANITNVEAIVKNKFEVTNGVLLLKEVNTDFTFDKFRFHLDNLFQGSEVGETVNESLNQQVDVLLKELKPGFVKEINKIVVQTLQKGLQNLPLKKWQAAIRK
ncbi:unnamed protein product [Plutella xylostella]|uniref:(diamondback moth) hypothetical protein n=1 Tax=Plutella xylostella TaxID=51655 RepID=A0A8S4G993_PLUXY|nr:unnamed protein product [Plutella xylostella]